MAQQVSATIVIPPPPPGFDEPLSGVFALLAGTMEVIFPIDATVVGTGSVLPTSNLGPFIFTGVNPPQLYTWDTSLGKYVPAALPPNTFIPKLIAGQDIKFCAGTVAQINAAQNPNGWYIADGSTVNGIIMPDLRNRMLIGQGSDFAIGSSGGGQNLANHTHNLPAVTDGHQLITGEIPSHNHTLVATQITTVDGTSKGAPVYGGLPNHAWADGNTGSSTTAATQGINNTGGDGLHTHGITGPSGNQNSTLSIMNPYYAVAILMFCGV